MSSCICGYHVYRKDWNPVIEELLEYKREITDNQDRYAVAVKRNRNIVGHLPRKIACVCSLFFHRGGSISCKVTGDSICVVLTIMCSIFVFSVPDENFLHDEYFPIYGRLSFLPGKGKR